MKSILSAALLASCVIYGQNAGQNAKLVNFDAASVKPAPALAVGGGDGKTVATKTGRDSIKPSGGPGTNDPGRIHYPSSTLKDLLAAAYDVQDSQITGPGWLDTERFSVEATMPSDTTMDRFRAMLQNLLVERFKITVHRETRELPNYSLRVGKNGPKMNGSVPVMVKSSGGVPLSELHSIVHASVMLTPPHLGFRWIASQATMQNLAKNLTDELHLPVTDATALNGKYNFTLNFSRETLRAVPPADAEAETESLPDIFSALKSIGLRVEETKVPLLVIVVDHAERTPIEN